jgi:hypothetical protein
VPLYVWEVEKEEQTMLEVSRRNKITQIRVEINKIENGKTIEKKSMKVSCFLGMINKNPN